LSHDEDREIFKETILIAMNHEVETFLQHLEEKSTFCRSVDFFVVVSWGTGVLESLWIPTHLCPRILLFTLPGENQQVSC